LQHTEAVGRFNSSFFPGSLLNAIEKELPGRYTTACPEKKDR